MGHLHVRVCSSGPPEARGETRGAHFCGNLRQSERMASTTTILKSSAMSLMKLPICLSRRSTLLSFPVLSSVVIASVAIVRFASLMSARPLQIQVARRDRARERHRHLRAHPRSLDLPLLPIIASSGLPLNESAHACPERSAWKPNTAAPRRVQGMHMVHLPR